MPTHFVIDDTEEGKRMANYLEVAPFASVVESDDSLQLASVDDRVKHALDCLKKEGLLVRKYDYAWIMKYINEEHIKAKGLFFSSVKSYRTYITNYMGHDDVAGLSTLSDYYSNVCGRHPEWTFTDTDDATERLRRINLAKRFEVIYTRGK